MDSTDIYIHCCPVCGCEINNYNYLTSKIISQSCIDCKTFETTSKQERNEKNIVNKQVAPCYISNQPISYYKNLSFKEYGDVSHWKEIFVKIELSNNPKFNQKQYEISCQRQIERNQRISQNNNQSTNNDDINISQPIQSNQPHCPTCNSTNIKRISDLRRGIHAVAWGLFSKTARSQFECKNCGMKF